MRIIGWPDENFIAEWGVRSQYALCRVFDSSLSLSRAWLLCFPSIHGTFQKSYFNSKSGVKILGIG